MQSWLENQTQLTDLARRQLFFIGGAPRSGTTWLQRLLDAHPDISCKGEGLFLAQLAVRLEEAAEQRRKALSAKNAGLFGHTGGYPLPSGEDVEHLTATAILLALAQQSAGKSCQAVGEKTPENVFFFERLKRMFPAARFIGIARDPRDVLTSAWHFFRKPAPGEDDAQAKMAFIASALPSIDHGARTMLALLDRFPGDCALVTYEGLRRDPAPRLAALFRHLGVRDDAALVAESLARCSFEVSTGGRPAGEALNGSFFRKGVAGDWASTLTPAMNERVLRELGWMFPRFGWEA